jgi:DNA-binding PadR family transcriptional regulator
MRRNSSNSKQPSDKYEQQLLSAWEEVYKKGQLTFWLMLALKEGPKYMADIKIFIDKATNGTLGADDQSMYRALRRYYDTELLDSSISEAGSSGPDRKIYRLSDLGIKVLDEFIERNIRSVYYKDEIKALLERNV